ncbi:hypothetical protein LguiB_035009 [Lonicera macranthoides]
MLLLNPSSMDGSENPTGWGQMEVELITVSKSGALISCAAMTFFYVAILYSPTLILRLPPTSSFKTFMIRRFICATVSSLVSLFLCALVLPVKLNAIAIVHDLRMRKWEVASIFGVYGIRPDYIWQAVVLPFLLTSLMYAGSMFLKCSMLLYSCKDHWSHGGDLSFRSMKMALQTFISSTISIASNVSAWRNYFVLSSFEPFIGVLYPMQWQLAQSFHGCRFPARLHCDLWVICIISFHSNRASYCSTCGPYFLQLHGLACDVFTEDRDGRGGICSWDGGLHLASISTNFPILV